MDRRTVLGFVLMALVYLGWTAWFAPRPEPGTEEAALESETGASPVPIEQPPVEEAVEFTPPPAQEVGDETPVSRTGWLSAAPEEDGDPLMVETDLFIAEFDKTGADLRSFRLKEFRTLDRQLVELIPKHSRDGGVERAHGLELVYEDDRREPLSNVQFNSNVDALTLDATKPSGELRLTARNGNGSGADDLELTLRFRNDLYGFEGELNYLSDDLLSSPVAVVFDWEGGIANTEPDTTQEYQEFRAFAGVGEDLHKKKFDDLRKDNGTGGRATHEGTVRMAGVSSRYFASAVVAAGSSSNPGFVRLDGDYAQNLQTFAVQLPTQHAERSVLNYGVYMGPLDMEALSPYAAEPYNARVGELVDLGPKIFRWASVATLWCLQALYKIIPNYGWVIIIFSTLTKLLFYPLTKSSTESMKRMQEIQPKLSKLKEKYKDDQQKQSQEMMALYKEHKINPMGGCLPLLVQMPVFIALFQVLRKTIELRQAPFVGWMQDLSRPDILFELPFTLPFLGSNFNLLPFLMAIGMWLQTKFTPQAAPAGDGAMAMNAKMMGTIMPFMMFFIFYNSPSGLVLYWLLNTLLTAWQTWHIQRKSPPLDAEAAPA